MGWDFLFHDRLEGQWLTGPPVWEALSCGLIHGEQLNNTVDAVPKGDRDAGAAGWPLRFLPGMVMLSPPPGG